MEVDDQTFDFLTSEVKEQGTTCESENESSQLSISELEKENVLNVLVSKTKDEETIRSKAVQDGSDQTENEEFIDEQGNEEIVNNGIVQPIHEEFVKDGTEALECPHCDYKKFSTRKGLSLHIFRMHELICGHCIKQFSSKSRVKVHIKRLHNFPCPKCKVITRELDDMKLHIWNAHMRISKAPRKKKKKPVKVSEEEEDNIQYPCMLCRSSFVGWTAFKLHYHEQHKKDSKERKWCRLPPKKDEEIKVEQEEEEIDDDEKRIAARKAFSSYFEAWEQKVEEQERTEARWPLIPSRFSDSLETFILPQAVDPLKQDFAKKDVFVEYVLQDKKCEGDLDMEVSTSNRKRQRKQTLPNREFVVVGKRMKTKAELLKKRPNMNKPEKEETYTKGSKAFNCRKCTANFLYALWYPQHNTGVANKVYTCTVCQLSTHNECTLFQHARTHCSDELTGKLLGFTHVGVMQKGKKVPGYGQFASIICAACNLEFGHDMVNFLVHAAVHETAAAKVSVPVLMM